MRHAAGSAWSSATVGLAVKVLENIVRIVLIVALGIAAVFFLGRLIVGFVGGQPSLLGMNPAAERGGCSSTPNCVSSYASTPEHAIDPIACAAPGDTAIAVFADAIDTLPDVDRRTETSWVVYSRFFRFPDDVAIQPSPRGIEVYSASRLGSGDLGVNRRRIEELREIIEDDPRCG